MADTDHIEVRVYIIGDYGVGKRAIAKRFKKLNSTETLQDNFFVQGDPRDAYGLGKKKDEKLLEAYNSYSIMDKYSIRKEIERIDLMTFAKVIEIEGYNLTFNFFPIFEAEKLCFCKFFFEHKNLLKILDFLQPLSWQGFAVLCIRQNIQFPYLD